MAVRKGTLPPAISSICVILTISRWNATTWIPENVISRLESSWPDAKLFVTNNRRHKAAARDKNMDVRLLSSPLLYSLDYEVYYRQQLGEVMFFSEFTKLKGIVLGSPHLRILYLKTRPEPSMRWGYDLGEVPTVRWDCDEPRPLNLNLQPSDLMPPLHELMVSNHPPYFLTREHCRVWSHCMDWSQLRSLDLSKRCPHNFLEQLCGRVTNLKSLCMAAYRCRDFSTGVRCREWKFSTRISL